MGFSCNYLDELLTVLCSSSVTFVLTLTKNRTEHRGIEGGMVFCFFPDKASSLPLEYGVDKSLTLMQ